jgi:hypothetical protein
MARTYGWAAPGLRLVRCAFANQRRNRASPARLGTSLAAMASVPQTRSNWARRASATWGNPDRVVVAGHTFGQGMYEDQGAGAFGSGAGEEDRRGVQFGQDRGLLGADRVQHRA